MRQGTLWQWLVCVLVSFCLLWQGGGVAYASLGYGSIGVKEEQEMGRQFNIMVRSQLPLLEDPEIRLYVESIVARLQKGMPPQPFPFTTSVLLHSAINAFATPGGYIFVHTGLIQNFEHESELAGVLAHEMGHVTQRHIASRMEKGQVIGLTSMIALLAGALLGGGSGKSAAIMGSMAASQTAMLSYSRADESDADQVALQYLIAAGYPPQGLINGFKKIRVKQWHTSSGIPEYLSTHPDITDRISTITARLETLPQAIRSRPENDARFKRAQVLIWARHGDLNAATERFRSIAADDALGQMGKGILFSRQNRVNEAEEAFNLALKRAPDDPLIMREAGIFHYNKGNLRKATRLLQQAMIKSPDDYYTFFFQARLMDDIGNHTEAQRLYREILRYVPEDSEVHFYYAQSLAQDKKLFEAYLHMAYSALYGNNPTKVKTYLTQAKAQKIGAVEQEKLDIFQKAFDERQEYWK